MNQKLSFRSNSNSLWHKSWSQRSVTSLSRISRSPRKQRSFTGRSRWHQTSKRFQSKAVGKGGRGADRNGTADDTRAVKIFCMLFDVFPLCMKICFTFSRVAGRFLISLRAGQKHAAFHSSSPNPITSPPPITFEELFSNSMKIFHPTFLGFLLWFSRLAASLINESLHLSSSHYIYVYK